MIDHEPFLSTIQADLHDDLPRLVYADWLEEQGDPRAEYLRLQVKLVRTWTYFDKKPELYQRLESLAETIEPAWLEAVRRCTTPAPPLDLAEVMPSMAALAQTTVRLHPRPGNAPQDASKLGGLILWPQRERWPKCPEHNIPMVSVLQLRKEDVPELGFPPGRDLFQLLWCQEQHQSLLAKSSPLPQIFWRSRAKVKRPQETIPKLTPVPGEYGFGALRPCRLHPERVVEYPDSFSDLFSWIDDIKGGGMQEVGSAKIEKTIKELSRLPEAERQYVHSFESLYQSWLSCANGIKVGGYPDWIQRIWQPVCECGEQMDYFLTYASSEYDGATWMRYIPIEDRAIRDRSSICTPADCLIGDCGRVFVFVCRHCPDWPVRACMQCC